MDPYIELAKIIAWPVVWIFGFIVLLVYRKPFGIFLSNLKKKKENSLVGEREKKWPWNWKWGRL